MRLRKPNRSRTTVDTSVWYNSVRFCEKPEVGVPRPAGRLQPTQSISGHLGEPKVWIMKSKHCGPFHTASRKRVSSLIMDASSRRTTRCALCGQVIAVGASATIHGSRFWREPKAPTISCILAESWPHSREPVLWTTVLCSVPRKSTAVRNQMLSLELGLTFPMQTR